MMKKRFLGAIALFSLIATSAIGCTKEKEVPLVNQVSKEEVPVSEGYELL